MPAGRNNTAVEIADDFGCLQLDAERLKKMVSSVCERFDVQNATISIAVVGNETIRKLNRQFLDRDRTTDVISFDLSEDSGSKMFEVVVNGRRAIEQAKLRGHEAESELALYVLHGLLHNLGFDDSPGRQVRKMRNTEGLILKQFGYGAVYGS